MVQLEVCTSYSPEDQESLTPHPHPKPVAYFCFLEV